MYENVRQLFFSGNYCIYSRLRTDPSMKLETSEKEALLDFAKDVNRKFANGTADSREIAMLTQMIAIMGCYPGLEWFHLDLANAFTKGIQY